MSSIPLKWKHQGTYGYTVDFRNIRQTWAGSTGVYKDFGPVSTLDGHTFNASNGYLYVEVDSDPVPSFQLNSSVWNFGAHQFSEAMIQIPVGSPASSSWVGPSVFMGGDTADSQVSNENYISVLCSDAGDGSSTYIVYQHDSGGYTNLGSAQGPDPAERPVLVRLEARDLEDVTVIDWWIDGLKQTQIKDSSADRIQHTTVSTTPTGRTSPGLAFGNNGGNDALRQVLWFRGGAMPERTFDTKWIPIGDIAPPPTTPTGVIDLRFPWTRQPPIGVPAKRDALPGLLYAKSFMSLHEPDSVGGAESDSLDFVHRIGDFGRNGQGGYMECTGITGDYFDANFSPEWVTGDTVSFVILVRTTDTACHVIGQREGSSASWQVYINPTVEFRTGTTNKTIPNMTTLYDGNWHVLSGSVKLGTGGDFYLDGNGPNNIVFTDTPTAGNYSMSLGCRWVSYASKTTAFEMDGDVAFAAVGNKLWSDAEHKTISDNLWRQFFEPRTVRILVDGAPTTGDPPSGGPRTNPLYRWRHVGFRYG